MSSQRRKPKPKSLLQGCRWIERPGQEPAFLIGWVSADSPKPLSILVLISWLGKQPSSCQCCADAQPLMLKSESMVWDRKPCFEHFSCQWGRWQHFHRAKLPVWKGWKIMEVAAQIGKKTEQQIALHKAGKKKKYQREYNIRNYFQAYISSNECAQ